MKTIKGQLSLFRTAGKPAYTSRDECVRYTEEARFEREIDLDECCGREPVMLFQSCHDYFVRCPVCKKQTKMHRHLYEAKQAWNRKEIRDER